MGKPEKTLWGGRFSTSLTTETIAFTHSIEADTRLIGYDIWGSQAHAIMPVSYTHLTLPTIYSV